MYVTAYVKSQNFLINSSPVQLNRRRPFTHATYPSLSNLTSPDWCYKVTMEGHGEGVTGAPEIEFWFKEVAGKIFLLPYVIILTICGDEQIANAFKKLYSGGPLSRLSMCARSIRDAEKKTILHSSAYGSIVVAARSTITRSTSRVFSGMRTWRSLVSHDISLG
jgi:hypothetical protein